MDKVQLHRRTTTNIILDMLIKVSSISQKKKKKKRDPLKSTKNFDPHSYWVKIIWSIRQKKKEV